MFHVKHCKVRPCVLNGAADLRAGKRGRVWVSLTCRGVRKAFGSNGFGVLAAGQQIEGFDKAFHK